MRTYLNKLTIGLTPWQIAVVLAVFTLSLIAAIGVALALRWWNERAVRSTHAVMEDL